MGELKTLPNKPAYLVFLRTHPKMSSLLKCVVALFFCSMVLAENAECQLKQGAYALLTNRAEQNSKQFFVYQTMDSAFNHGYPLPIGTAQPSFNQGCIDDPNAPEGCSTNEDVLDVAGNRLQLQWAASNVSTDWGGIEYIEPQNYPSPASSRGYDLSGTDIVLFSVRSPTGIKLQFGVGGSVTRFVPIAKTRKSYSIVCLTLVGMAKSACPNEAVFKLDLHPEVDVKSVHVLFAAVTNQLHAPNGGAILIKDVGYYPFPPSRLNIPSLPLSTQTFGIVPVEQFLTGRVPVPPDQVNRNVAALYESSLAILAFFHRGDRNDLRWGFRLADDLVYALHHDNNGDRLPPPKGGGLHNGYEAGDLPFFNTEGASKRGQVRLAGFSVAPDGVCGSAGYCLVLDGGTGGNNAFAILALLKAYSLVKNPTYLAAATRIGEWIYNQLLDTRKVSFGGYFVGYPDGGDPEKKRETGKSTENNADIFAAFTALAAANSEGRDRTSPSVWTSRAKIAGDFVMNMYNKADGCFYAGTVPPNTPAGPGIDPNGPVRGRDITNTYDFFDSDSFTYLAMSQSAQYGHAIDWSNVVKCLAQFHQSVTADGVSFEGYNIVKKPDCETAPKCGPNGVAWEFTGQAAVVTKLSGGNAGSILTAIEQAQTAAPFGDGEGLVASTMQNGDLAHLHPYEECLSTPFQCIPERVGIAATVWAIFAQDGYNPLVLDQ